MIGWLKTPSHSRAHAFWANAPQRRSIRKTTRVYIHTEPTNWTRRTASDVVEGRAIMPGARIISFEDAAAAVVPDGMGYWGTSSRSDPTRQTRRETTGSLGTVPSRRPKVASSRTNPNFHFFAKPELYDPWKSPTPQGTHPIWDHPNMSVMARVFYTNVTDTKYSPPNYFDLWGYTPDSYLTQVARRLAGWFEYQGFTNAIKCMMNTNGSRTSRMGRTYRICG